MSTRTFSSFSSRFAALALLALLSLGLTGCVGMWSNYRRHEASSVVNFLYPGKEQPFITPTIPTLRLPLRVGIAFIPAGHGGPHNNHTSIAPSKFTESEKTALLRRVSAQFKTLPFVESIQIVPTTYLRAGGGFDNLDQLKALMGIDVVALIAYDQAQNTHDTEWSLAYWTIVGAYVVPAQKNETHTLMEAVVYDIASRSLLFRAPGTSAVKGHATLVRNREELKNDSSRGLNEAANDMTAHLAQELELFKVRAKEEPDAVKIEHRPGYTGGGALDLWLATMLAIIIGGCWLSRRK
ncbi:rhombotarget lipoprotein [Oleiharenicola lentus]|uniref:rhombotarget lipoprotein n=1 Tax=Oleiharenicola lentus TaxID=2508720 RepID=UPI003F666D0D